MGKPNQQRRESAWLTVRQLADALDVTEGFVRREVLRRVPNDMVRRNCRPMTVYARGAIEAWLRGTVSLETKLGSDDLELMSLLLADD